VQSMHEYEMFKRSNKNKTRDIQPNNPQLRLSSQLKN
jgi:hypothetical protein